MAAIAEHDPFIELVLCVGFGIALTLVQLTWDQMVERQWCVSFAKLTLSVFWPSGHLK